MPRIITTVVVVEIAVYVAPRKFMWLHRHVTGYANSNNSEYEYVSCVLMSPFKPNVNESVNV